MLCSPLPTPLLMHSTYNLAGQKTTEKKIQWVATEGLHRCHLTHTAGNGEENSQQWWFFSTLPTGNREGTTPKFLGLRELSALPAAAPPCYAQGMRRARNQQGKDWPATKLLQLFTAAG